MDQSNDSNSTPETQAKILSFADAMLKRSESNKASKEAVKVLERKPTTQPNVKASNESSSFDDELKRFEDTQRRLSEERLKANKNVLKSYKIKETKDEQ